MSLEPGARFQRDLVISNVPGPQVPVYLAGARMLTNYPTSIVMHGIALNITVESYDWNLDFGLTADAMAVPDMRDFAQGLHQAMGELRATQARDDAARARRRRPTAVRARPAKSMARN